MSQSARVGKRLPHNTATRATTATQQGGFVVQETNMGHPYRTRHEDGHHTHKPATKTAATPKPKPTKDTRKP